MNFDYQQWQRNFEELQSRLRDEPQAEWRSTLDERWAQFVIERVAQQVAVLAAQAHMTGHPWDESYRFDVANKLAVLVADLNTATALIVHGVAVRDPEAKEATLRLFKAASLRGPQPEPQKPVKLRQYRVSFVGNGNTLLVLNTDSERVLAQFPAGSIERIEELRDSDMTASPERATVDPPPPAEGA